MLSLFNSTACTRFFLWHNKMNTHIIFALWSSSNVWPIVDIYICNYTMSLSPPLYYCLIHRDIRICVRSLSCFPINSETRGHNIPFLFNIIWYTYAVLFFIVCYYITVLCLYKMITSKWNTFVFFQYSILKECP